MRDLKAFLEVSALERSTVFRDTARDLKTSPIHIEKDFWVSFILNIIFNSKKEEDPRILFKGGTSLSKVYDLISRFSEDIDITIFKEDLGFHHTTEDLMAMTNKPRKRILDAMTEKCGLYIKTSFKESVSSAIEQIFSKCGIKEDQWNLKEDPSDTDGQSLSFEYPSILIEDDQYIQKRVKLEAGCKSALNPHKLGSVKPYISHTIPSIDLNVNNVTTISPSRTLWDKFTILHALNNRSLNGWEPRDGHRNSRHYYDVYRLMNDSHCIESLHDFDLSNDVRNHTKQYFNRGPAMIDQAKHSTITLVPNKNLEESLRKDYTAMSGMIFGDIPDFSNILKAIDNAELRLHEISQEINT